MSQPPVPLSYGRVDQASRLFTLTEPYVRYLRIRLFAIMIHRTSSIYVDVDFGSKDGIVCKLFV